MSNITPTSGNPPDPKMEEKLTLNEDDSEELQSAKLKYQATIDSQVVQGCVNSCRVYQDGARGVGVQT
ncbi:hypothetical protein OU995_07740 [Roseateles sp. SL47]|uniref:hypothetical protein n=1 Tax=Roseateles sp. SL47 TaxID=2995138 RepID=UPI00226F6D5E|nr:hypothetical protein [Roseateles sp. SL47]WAC74587.1 hypothetical protein OU995_07740 [Roseateles sp. SL47]